MSYLKKPGSILISFVVLLLLSQSGFAQHNTISIPELVNQHRTGVLSKVSDIVKVYGTIEKANMPVYNPDEGAKIRVYTPSKDRVYNMPVYGYKKSALSDIEILNFNHKKIPDKEK